MFGSIVVWIDYNFASTRNHYFFHFIFAADAEVISIDACVREPNGIIVGVTLIKNSEPKEIFFNLYGVKCDPEAPFSWDKVAGAV